MDYGQPDMEDMDGNVYLGEKEHAVIKYEDGTQEKDFSEEGRQFAEEFKLKEGISGF